MMTLKSYNGISMKKNKILPVKSQAWKLTEQFSQDPFHQLR